MVSNDPVIIMCQREINGDPNRLIDFLSKHGQDVVAVVNDGIIFRGNSHYIVSSNSGCTGCEDCKKRDISDIHK